MGRYLDIVRAFEARKVEAREEASSVALSSVEGEQQGSPPEALRSGPYEINEKSPLAAPWPERAADLIRWFQTRRAELPTGEFWLNVWTKVSDPELFYAGLDRDIAQGPRGPRAEALADDLNQLFERWAMMRKDVKESSQ